MTRTKEFASITFCHPANYFKGTVYAEATLTCEIFLSSDCLLFENKQKTKELGRSNRCQTIKYFTGLVNSLYAICKLQPFPPPE